MENLLDSALTMITLRKLIVVCGLWVLFESVRHKQYGLAFALVWPLFYYAATVAGDWLPNVARDTPTVFKTMATFGWVGVLGWVYYAQRRLATLQRELVRVRFAVA